MQPPKANNHPLQGCQMVYFPTKIPNFGNFLKAWEWNIFGILCGHLFHFQAIWYIFGPFVMVLPSFWYIESRKIWQP
jgi:hypothetical protein